MNDETILKKQESAVDLGTFSSLLRNHIKSAVYSTFGCYCDYLRRYAKTHNLDLGHLEQVVAGLEHPSDDLLDVLKMHKQYKLIGYANNEVLKPERDVDSL